MQFTRIDKRQARKLWNTNKTFIIVPCNCGAGSFFAAEMGPATFEKMMGYDFDRMVNAFEYYNCGKEAGRYAAFYVKD